MFDQKSAPYLAWKKLGERIRNDVRDGVIAANKGIVAVSAHWEADQSSGKVVQRAYKVLLLLACVRPID